MKHSEGPSLLKPWWKSVGFWMGAVGAVFLGWVWAQSTSNRYSLYHASSSRISAVSVVWGSVEKVSVRAPGSHWLPLGWNVEAVDLGKPDPKYYFNSPVSGRWMWNGMEENGVFERHILVSIPIWFVTTCWCSGWLGGLALWRRRLRKKMGHPTVAIGEADREL